MASHEELAPRALGRQAHFNAETDRFVEPLGGALLGIRWLWSILSHERRPPSTLMHGYIGPGLERESIRDGSLHGFLLAFAQNAWVTTSPGAKCASDACG